MIWTFLLIIYLVAYWAVIASQHRKEGDWADFYLALLAAFLGYMAG